MQFAFYMRQIGVSVSVYAGKCATEEEGKKLWLIIFELMRFFRRLKWCIETNGGNKWRKTRTHSATEVVTVALEKKSRNNFDPFVRESIILHCYSMLTPIYLNLIFQLFGIRCTIFNPSVFFCLWRAWHRIEKLFVYCIGSHFQMGWNSCWIYCAPSNYNQNW